MKIYEEPIYTVKPTPDSRVAVVKSSRSGRIEKGLKGSDFTIAVIKYSLKS